MSNKKPIVSVDFDGVLNSYVTGWQGARNIPDPPVPGAIAWLHDILQSGKVQVCILSYRSHQWGGRYAMKKWLSHHVYELMWKRYGDGQSREIGYAGYGWNFQDMHSDFSRMTYDLIDRIDFPRHKPPATLTIDGRAVTFRGTFPTVADMLHFKPWRAGEYPGVTMPGWWLRAPGPSQPPRPIRDRQFG